MKDCIDSDVYVSPKFGIDSDLVLLQGKDGITLPILQLYHAWRRGICEEDIAIPASEHAASIEKVKRLLPEKTLQTDIHLRNEIIESQVRMKKIAQGESQDTQLTADALLKRGQNPGHWLRKLREEISEDLSVQVDDIRRESVHASTNEPTIDLAAHDSRLAMALRERDKKPTKPIMPENPAKYEYPCDPTEQNAQATNDQEQKPRDIRTDRRITVRLDQALHDKIRQHSQDAGVEMSMVVRRALSQFLEGDKPIMAENSNEMPQEALSLIGRYQTWGSDLREELWKQFLRTIAAAHTTSRRWNRDERSRRLSEGLIQLYHSLEGFDVRQK
jgi:hypothetical protein